MTEHVTMPGHLSKSSTSTDLEDLAGSADIDPREMSHDPLPSIDEPHDTRQQRFKHFRLILLTFHLVLLAVTFSMGVGWVTVTNYGNPGVFQFMVPAAAGFLIAWAALSYVFSLVLATLWYFCRVRFKVYAPVSILAGLYIGYVAAHYCIRIGAQVVLMVFYGSDI